MFGNLKIIGNRVYLPGYKDKEPSFNEIKNIRGRCSKCRRTNERTMIFVGNSNNKSHTKCHGRINANCGDKGCGGKVDLHYVI